MKIEIWLHTSRPIELDVIATYEKGSLFCVATEKSVYKYPISNILYVKEDLEFIYDECKES